MYQLTVDYSQSLEGMIKAGKYDWVNSNITRDNFPTNHHGMQTIEVELIHFGKELTTQEIEVELENQSLRPATLEELLAFGAKYPDKQREYSIVALGSGWVGPGGCRYVPCLYGFVDGRRLDLDWDDPDDQWLDRCRFLTVSKSSESQSLGKEIPKYTPEQQKLLEHYAGLAMQGELSSQSPKTAEYTKNNFSFLAQFAYDIAEAMLEERRKRV